MKFAKNHLPVTAERLEAFERDRGVRFPESYRAFLLENNGGYGPTPGYLNAKNWGDTVVQAFMGIDTGSSYSIAEVNFYDLSIWLNRYLVPIAEDPGGQIFVVDLRQKSFGKIYVRDHDGPSNIVLTIDDTGMDDTDQASTRIFHPIAESFDDFIAMLGPGPG